MLNLLESSPYFVKCRTKQAMAEAEEEFTTSNKPVDHIYWTTATPTSVIAMSNGANYKLISSAGGLLGQTILCGNFSEISFFTDEGWSDEKIFKFFYKLRTRIESRMKGNFYGRFILDSSPNTMESVIDKWIWEDAPKSKLNYIVSGSRWKHFPLEFPDFKDTQGNIIKENSFALYKGGNGKASCVLPEEAVEEISPLDYVICPKNSIGTSYIDMARENPIEFLRDQCGIPSGSADRLLNDPFQIEACFTHKLKTLFTHIQADTKEDPEHLIWDQIKTKYFNKILDRYYFWYKPEIPRALTIDQSFAKDCTGISLSHVERDPTRIDPNTGDMMKIYITDFTIMVIPNGGVMNLEAFKFFIMDLARLGNMKILHVSLDSFQSVSTVQSLERFGIDAEHLSVDKTNDPYFNFIDMVVKGRWKTGFNIYLKNNMSSLQMQKRSKNGEKNAGSAKVEHMTGDIVTTGPTLWTYDETSWKMMKNGINAKDGTDSVVGTIELLNKYSNEYVPTSIWVPDTIKEKNYVNAKIDAKKLMDKLGFF